jgi:uncharacterized protein DUF1833
MPRTVSSSLRRELEEPRSAEFLVILLTIEDPTLASPIRVANDVINYNYNGDTYFGFPFEFELVDDSASGRIPTARIRIQNVDRQIGEAIVNLTQSPVITITMLASSDFATTLSGDDARFPIVDTPVVEYQATNLMFTNISVNAMEVTAELISFDMTSEPWPAIRTTADRLPGLDP